MIRYQKFPHLAWVTIDISKDSRFPTLRSAAAFYRNRGFKVQIFVEEINSYTSIY